ncbi:hypothetical protein [[Anoxybacillus] calidus]|jgi:hypothetical protein|uniref:hypothetical protein n=1 Tax=[Anoxybacillus] calidus TaxID=575178 RepID=UPI0015EC7647|nr:hypothetical protein [Anoxybacillus calidus]
MSLLIRLIMTFIILIVFTGCNNDKPEPETKVHIEPVMSRDEAMPVLLQTDERTMNVKHQVRGTDVFIECIVTNFSFKSGKRKKVDGEGHVNLYVNGQKVDEVSTAAFILKGLPKGKHVIRLELVHNDSSKYGLHHEFEVNIS